MKRTVYLFIIMCSLFSCVKKERPFTLPDSVGEYRAEERLNFEKEELFSYINGGAELYLSYGFTRMTGAIYTAKDLPKITAEIYEMTSPENAFGVFTLSRETEDARYGQLSQTNADYILFWKGRYFVIVKSEGTVEEMAQLAKAVDREIKSAGEIPAIVKALPKEGLLGAGYIWFHNPIWLNSYYFIADYDILHITAKVSAVLGKYGSGEGARYYLLVADYPSDEEAKAAYYSLKNGYAPELSADETVLELEDGSWFGIWLKGKRLAAMFNAPSKQAAEKFIVEQN